MVFPLLASYYPSFNSISRAIKQILMEMLSFGWLFHVLSLSSSFIRSLLLFSRVLFSDYLTWDGLAVLIFLFIIIIFAYVATVADASVVSLFNTTTSAYRNHNFIVWKHGYSSITLWKWCVRNWFGTICVCARMWMSLCVDPNYSNQAKPSGMERLDAHRKNRENEKTTQKQW